MSAPEDEEPIEALSTNGTHESLGECVGSRRSNRRLDDSDALGRNTSSKLEVNFVSLSRMRNLAAREPLGKDRG